jgi:RNA polymerase sigma-70 factor, ECF subfamily
MARHPSNTYFVAQPRTSPPEGALAPVSHFPYERLADAELVQAVVRGNSQAVGVVWDRYSPIVRSVVRTSLGPDASAEDIVQDVFVAFLRAAGSMRDASAVRGFLIGVAVRLVALELRRRKIRRWVTLSPSGSLPETPVLPRDLEGREALEGLYRLLARMPSRRRLALMLRTVQGCEILEVAAALGVSESTAKREVIRAQEQLLKQASREPALLQYLETTAAAQGESRHE